MSVLFGLGALVVAAPPQSLDAAGVDRIMSSPTPALVRFDRGPTPAPGVQLWQNLADDFATTPLLLGAVDCTAEAEACAARKVSFAPGDAGPVIKYWSGEASAETGKLSWRRYAGSDLRQPLRDYLVKKMRLTVETSAPKEAPLPPQMDEALRLQRLATTLLGVLTLLIVCNMLTLWLKRPHVEAAGTLVLVGGTDAVSLIRLDADGELTPVGRRSMPNNGAASGSGLPLGMAVDPVASRRLGAYVVHVGHERAPSAEGGELLTLLFDPRASPFLEPVAFLRGGHPSPCQLSFVPDAARRGGGVVACSPHDGSARLVTTSPIEQGWFAPWRRGYHRRAAAAGSHGVTLGEATTLRDADATAAATLAPACSLVLGGKGRAGEAATPVRLLVGGRDGLYEYALSASGLRALGKEASGLVGRMPTPDGCEPCALAAHPSGKAVYALTADGHLLVCELSPPAQGGNAPPAAPPKEVQRLPLLRKALSPPKPRTGASSGADDGRGGGGVCVSADGKHVYAAVRGLEAVVCLGVTKEGRRLSVAAHVSATGGGVPSGGALGACGLSLTADGAMLLLADRDAQRITSFVRSADSGRLAKAKHLGCEVGGPVVPLRWPPRW